MSNWDEKVADAAFEHAKPQMRPVQTLNDHMAEAFHYGARWQREALLSDEAVDRAARALNDAGLTCPDGAHEPGQYDECDYCKGATRRMAQAALTAALGEEETDE